MARDDLRLDALRPEGRACRGRLSLGIGNAPAVVPASAANPDARRFAPWHLARSRLGSDESAASRQVVDLGLDPRPDGRRTKGGR